MNLRVKLIVDGKEVVEWIAKHEDGVSQTSSYVARINAGWEEGAIPLKIEVTTE